MAIKIKNIIITGSSGLIGSQVEKYFKENTNYFVMTTSRKEEKNNKNHFKFDFFKENFSTKFKNICIDAIIHCAAVIPDSKTLDVEAFEQNQLIDSQIISYCIDYPQVRLIYLSTAFLYKLDKFTYNTESTPIKNVLSGYFRSKYLSEKLIQKKLLNFVIARISSPYCKIQKNKNVLSKFVEDSVWGTSISYFGAGTRTQDFIHTSDISKAIEKMIYLNDVNGLFNIASGDPISMLNLANLVSNIVLRICNKKILVTASGFADSQESHRANISIDKARDILGWQPQTRLNLELKNWIEYLIYSKKESI